MKRICGKVAARRGCAWALATRVTSKRSTAARSTGVEKVKSPRPQSSRTRRFGFADLSATARWHLRGMAPGWQRESAWMAKLEEARWIRRAGREDVHSRSRETGGRRRRNFAGLGIWARWALEGETKPPAPGHLAVGGGG